MCADAASTLVDICRIQATARRFGAATRRAPFAKPQPRRILFTKIANFPHLRKFFPRKISNLYPLFFRSGLGEGLPEVVGRNGGGDVDLLAADGMHKLDAMALQRDAAVGVAALRSVFQVAFDWATDG